MALSAQEVRQIKEAARQVTLVAPAERVEDFVCRVLGLNAVGRTQYFPSPDPAGLMAIAVGHLTAEREKILGVECSVPSFAVFHDTLKIPKISGFYTYLEAKPVDAQLRGRLNHHQDVR